MKEEKMGAQNITTGSSTLSAQLLFGGGNPAPGQAVGGLFLCTATAVGIARFIIKQTVGGTVRETVADLNVALLNSVSFFNTTLTPDINTNITYEVQFISVIGTPSWEIRMCLIN